MATRSAKRLVHSSTLQQMFKDVGYEWAIVDKTARPGVPYKDDPGPPHQLPGTRSQSVLYFLEGAKVAVCHQYVLPSGRFGASGLPDPKLLAYQGHVLYCHSAKCSSVTCAAAPEDWRAVMEELKTPG